MSLEHSPGRTGRLRTRRQAAAFLAEAYGPAAPKESTLAAMASKGGGPVISYVGDKPYYEDALLISWFESRVKRCASTSELNAA